MSMQSWKEEFYPLSAIRLVYLLPESSHDSTREIALIEHSLRKWIGLRPENLAKHGLKRDLTRAVIRPIDEHSAEDCFYVDSETCSLCVEYHNDDLDCSHEESCTSCPLYQALGYPCDQSNYSGVARPEGPYAIWSVTFDGKSTPEPMIAALEQTLSMAKGK